MSKDITIQEGGIAKQLSSIKKLQTAKQGGGTVLWVPEDEVQLTTKQISKNGTYKASDDGKYGYSQVTVSGIGIASGTWPVSSGGDGNEWAFESEEDPTTHEPVTTGTALPSSIDITTNPTKTEYIDEETIDISGMVVKAYKKDGNLWSNSNYPNGIVPNNEITINPTAASEESGEGGSYNVLPSMTLLYTHAVPLSPLRYIWAITEGDARIIIERASTSFQTWGFSRNGGQFAIVTTTSSTPPIAYDMQSGSGKSGVRSGNISLAAGLNVVDIQYIQMDKEDVAYSYAYGGSSGGNTENTITASWGRPKDGKILKDTFKITVVPSNEGNNTGGGGDS